jgi:hypothetical protein
LNTYVAVHAFFNTAVQQAISAFMDNMRGVSIHALRKGMRSIGVKDHERSSFPNGWMPSRCF